MHLFLQFCNSYHLRDSGREGLVDTAVKTAETGYMARRLMKALEDLSMQYDTTVRNSENIVVQFTYGDDGLNPSNMENNDRPVDFNRLSMTIREDSPCRDESTLPSQELMETVKAKLMEERFQSLLPEGREFINEIETYFESIAKKYEQLVGAMQGDTDDIGNLTWNSCRYTASQLDIFFDRALAKCKAAYVEPGEAVGAVGAQSISEPGTQMTLKTFHFSGISSMNVTLGVPRLKEIINASKLISTPIITAKLEQDDNKIAARVVKAGIEKTTLGEVSKCMKEVFSPNGCYISIELDMGTYWQTSMTILEVTCFSSANIFHFVYRRH
jgi:DNA-directed RNA polymerase III subunit RPC1